MILLSFSFYSYLTCVIFPVFPSCPCPLPTHFIKIIFVPSFPSCPRLALSPHISQVSSVTFAHTLPVQPLDLFLFFALLVLFLLLFQLFPFPKATPCPTFHWFHYHIFQSHPPLLLPLTSTQTCSAFCLTLVQFDQRSRE